MQTVRPQDPQNVVADQQRRQLFLRYVNRGWLAIGLAALIAWPFLPAQRGEFTVVAAITLPSYLLIRYLNLSGRTRLAGIVFVTAINFGFYGLFLYLAREMGAAAAFATQATVWQLMGLAVLLAGSLVNKWAAPGLALLNTALFIITRLALAPASDPRPSVIVFWWMAAVITWLYENTGRQAEAQREAALAELRDNRRFLADLIEYSGALIFVKDRAGRYELINRKWEEVTGLKRADVLGKTDEVLFPGPIGQQFRANDREVIETGEVLEREEILEDEQGSRYFISIKFPVRDEGGHIRGTCGMTTEITERKRAEQALAESEAIFQLFMEHSPIYVFFKDEQLRPVRLSKNYEQMLGRPLPELLGKTMDDLFPSALAKSMMADDTRILREGRQIEVVEELNGRIYTTTKFPIVEVGRPRWLAGYTIDITEQTRAVEALRQSEDKFSKAFHISPDAVSITRLSDGLFLEVNQGFTTMMGYASAEVLGKTSLELNLWVNSADRAQLVESVRERGQAVNMETSFHTRAGRIIVGLMSARPIEIGGEKCILAIVRDITDRKRAEEEILSLSRFPNENPNPVLRLNRDGDIMYANAASRNLLKAWVRSTGDETLVYWRRLAMETLANGENQMLDIVCDRQVFEFTVVPILESGYVNLYGRDVTERDRVEQALRASEERYQNFISQSFEGISRTEFDQPIDTTLPVETQIDLIYENAYMAECNQALADMYHLPSAESFSGARLIDAHGGKDNPINRAAFRRLIENGYKSMGDETAEYRADGEPIWLLSNTVGTIENSHLVRLWGTALDITERKRADAALRESEQKMRAIVDAAPYGAHLYELHPDERLVFMGANPAADQILHVDHRQFIGRTIEEAFPPLGETEVPAAYRRVAATGEEFQMDQIAYDDAGISGAFELHAFQIGSNQMAVFFHDVTERKKMEEALRRLNEDLELRVVKRTQELAAANARLTELDQLKSKFVSDVSHELRTPIANLKLYIDLLERGKPEKQTQYIQTLHQQVRRVAALVDDILDLSRLEQRKEQGLIYRVVELNDVVGQVVQAHQPRAEADGLQLIFEPATPLPPVRADANQLAQVVTNLVANALSYTTAGYVRVSTFAQDAEVCLCVADSGSGIALEDLPHVFDRFYRGQYVLKNDVPGTGLGLAIVKEIVDLHEGRIEVDSQPDRGTTFRVWLPVVQNT